MNRDIQISSRRREEEKGKSRVTAIPRGREDRRAAGPMTGKGTLELPHIDILESYAKELSAIFATVIRIRCLCLNERGG